MRGDQLVLGIETDYMKLFATAIGGQPRKVLLAKQFGISRATDFFR